MLSSLGFVIALKQNCFSSVLLFIYFLKLLFLTTLFGIGFSCLFSSHVSETSSVFSRILRTLFRPSQRLRGAQWDQTLARTSHLVTVMQNWYRLYTVKLKVSILALAVTCPEM